MRLRRATLRALVAACGAALVAAAAPSLAAESVGRATFELPSPAWKELVAYEHPMTYMTSGVTIPLFTKAYVLPGPGPIATGLLIVTGTDGSAGGRTMWVSEICPEPRDRYFSNDYDSNKLTRVRECIVVNPGFVATKFFRADDPVLAALKQQGVELAPSAYSLRSVVALQGGALLRVHLVADKAFLGKADAAPAASDLHGVAPSLVAWAESLHDAMRASVTSLGGTFQLPAIAFRSR